MAIYTDYRTPDTVVTDAAAINNSIRNILLTRKGSMPGKPDFGSRVQELLFNQLDDITKDVMRRYVKEALKKWETRITVIDVFVTDVPEFNKLVATIEYQYRDAGLDINEQISVGFTQ